MDVYSHNKQYTSQDDVNAIYDIKYYCTKSIMLYCIIYCNMHK